MSKTKVPTVKMALNLLEGIEAPSRGSERAAALDLRANVDGPVLVQPGQTVMIPTGVYLDMTEDPTVAALVLPRSGLGAKQGLVLGNGTGLIDNDYQGEIKIAALKPSRRLSAAKAALGPRARRNGQVQWARGSSRPFQFTERHDGKHWTDRDASHGQDDPGKGMGRARRRSIRHPVRY